MRKKQLFIFHILINVMVLVWIDWYWSSYNRQPVVLLSPSLEIDTCVWMWRHVYHNIIFLVCIWCVIGFSTSITIPISVHHNPQRKINMFLICFFFCDSSRWTIRIASTLPWSDGAPGKCVFNGLAIFSKEVKLFQIYGISPKTEWIPLE